ncbi:MAG: FAD-dependent monooxygenase [Sphingobium sp.]
MDTPVLIAGGGPVGMTLALTLAQHGVPAILVERNPTTTRSPKMDITNGRSMELFRRLGIVEKLRAVGVPQDEPFDVVWATRLTGHILHRFHYPSPNTKRAQIRDLNDGSQTLEPPMRVSQIVIEPVLKAAIDENPLIDVRFGWAFEKLEQDSEGVIATIQNSETGAREQIRCLYLAGCDGGGSRVRRSLGIELEGRFGVTNAYMVHFKSVAHDILSRFGTTFHFQTGLGTVIAQNGIDTWTLQSRLPPDTDPSTIDPAEWLRKWVGQDFDFQILVANPWTPHLVIADRYIDGRVLLAGDSVHQVIPSGGYGMNTGIGDAVDLGWKLASVVNGWGGHALLESYENERRQIAIQNRAAASRHSEVRAAIGQLIVEAEREVDLDRPDAADRRKELGDKIAALGNAENESWGIEHGYRYEASPVIWPAEAGEVEPPFDPLVCTPTTWPGARLPSLFLSDGRALYDLLGLEFTLLVIGQQDTRDFEQAAETLGVPLDVVQLEPEPKLDLLERRMLLIRPDHHVAWRGESIPSDCTAVLAHVCGRSASDVTTSGASMQESTPVVAQ